MKGNNLHPQLNKGSAGRGAQAWEILTRLPPRLTNFITARPSAALRVACAMLFLICLFRYRITYDPNASIRVLSEMPRVAHNLYENGQFANPFASLDTGPSAHLTPVFPVYMALLMNTFGDNAMGEFALELAGALIVAIQVALFPLFSSRLGMGKINGIVGACIWIVAKPKLVYNWEAFYAAILIALACCIYRRYLDSEVTTAGRLAWLLGCLMGILVLTIPTTLPVLAAWLGWETWRRKLAFLKKSFLPLVLLPATIITPWIIRNYLVFQRFLLRDDFGLELSVANNDCAQFSVRKNLDSGCFNKVHPNQNVNVAREVLALGEAQYSDLRLREALHWIAGHPARFVRLTGMRFIAFWLPTESGTIHYAGSGRRLERVLIYLMTLLSIKGWMTLHRRDIKSSAVCMSFLALYPLVYYIVQFADRYRYPILWITFLLGAFPITGFLRAIRQPVQRLRF